MARNRSLPRIALNITLDAILAAGAVPVAYWLARPGGALPAWWEWPAGALALLLGGLPFRLSTQYWRFAGLGDLLGVAGGSLAGAALFALLLRAGGTPWPNLGFPLIHMLTLLALLGAPRVVYRLSQEHRHGEQDPHAERQPPSVGRIGVEEDGSEAVGGQGPEVGAPHDPGHGPSPPPRGRGLGHEGEHDREVPIHFYQDFK